MKVAIFGLGYVGLPLAVLCAKAGHSVIGIDTSKRVVELTNKGISHMADQKLKIATEQLKGKIRASTDAAEAAGADVAIVCVPTPVDEQKRPDLAAVKAASQAIAKTLHRGKLVIIESTVYPGTLEDVVLPILENSGLKGGKDFMLAHCPERIDPGNEKWPLEKIPRVLGALTPEGAERAKEFYESILEADVMVLNSVKAAEAVKVTENAFRDINIAFVNELAMSLDRLGIDVLEVIRGASTKPFGYMPFYPGPGVGGHCIAVDPYYLIEKAREAGFSHEFLKLARKINDSMAGYVEKTALESIGKAGIKPKDAKIAVLGRAYKPDVSDTRDSPALRVIGLLKKRGIFMSVFDPQVSEPGDAESLADALKGANVLLLLTHHAELVRALDAKTLKNAGIKVVVDARNVLDRSALVSEGIVYKGIGR